MILLDADILLLDIRYPRDSRFDTNAQLLKALQERALERGITLYALLEVVGVLSFNLPTDQIQRFYTLLLGRYGLHVVQAWRSVKQSQPLRLPRCLLKLRRRWL